MTDRDTYYAVGLLKKLNSIVTTAHPERIGQPIPLAAAEAIHCISTMVWQRDQLVDALQGMLFQDSDISEQEKTTRYLHARAAIEDCAAPPPESPHG